MENVWTNPALVEAYAQKNDPKDWYEREVNMPAMMSLLPKERAKLLDHGCGTGDFTAELGALHEVEGTDISPRMIELARAAHPNITFTVWDGMSQYPDARIFDVVVSKLVLMFLEDLNAFAERSRELLVPDGSLVFSVAHPMSTSRKVTDYFAETPYDAEIGDSGIRTVMIHRTLETYLRPFIEHGFVLTALTEPRITSEQSKKYNVSADELIVPKRLIARLTRI